MYVYSTYRQIYKKQRDIGFLCDFVIMWVCRLEMDIEFVTVAGGPWRYWWRTGVRFDRYLCLFVQHFLLYDCIEKTIQYLCIDTISIYLNLVNFDIFNCSEMLWFFKNSFIYLFYSLRNNIFERHINVLKTQCIIYSNSI